MYLTTAEDDAWDARVWFLWASGFEPVDCSSTSAKASFMTASSASSLELVAANEREKSSLKWNFMQMWKRDIQTKIFTKSFFF